MFGVLNEKKYPSLKLGIGDNTELKLFVPCCTFDVATSLECINLTLLRGHSSSASMINYNVNSIATCSLYIYVPAVTIV